MAFRQSEIRMVLGIQAYGTGNLTRLRRDINSLGRAVDVAQANQTRVAEAAARSMQRAQSIRTGIATKEAAIRSRLERAHFARTQAFEKLDQRRTRLMNAQDRIGSRAAAKRLQIAGTEARIQKLTAGSSALQTQLKSMGIQRQLDTLGSKRTGLLQKEMGLQSSIRNNRARQLDLERALLAAEVSPERIAKYRQANANLGGMGSKMRSMVLRLQAADIRAKKLASQLGDVAHETAAIDAEAKRLNMIEERITAEIREQAGALSREQQLLKVQNAQLRGIETRYGEIQAEIAALTTEEARLNSLDRQRLATINAQKAALAAETLELQQQEAITRRLLGEEMARARAADARAAKMERIQRTEVIGRSVSHAGRTAQFGGLIGTAVIGAAGAAYANFNREASLAGTQMRDVNATWEQAVVRAGRLENKILEMMQVFPATAEEMSNSAYEIFSSMNLVEQGVVNVAKGFRLMTIANKMAVAGQVDLEEATSAMIVVLNNFDPELKNVTQTMNQVFSIVRFGQMRLSDFAAAMVPLAPVAKTVGLSLTDVGAALASLTILFKSPQQAAQGLARAIELLQLEPFRKGLKELEVEVNNTVTGRMRPLHAILEDLTKAFPEAATSQKAMVTVLTQISQASGMTKAGIQGTVQARRALAGLITSMNLYRNILQNITNNQGEFNDAFNAMKDTPGVQWQVFTNQLRAFVLVIGRAALPYLLQLGDSLIKVAHWIEDMIKKTDGAVVKWGLWISVAALLGGTFLSMAGGIVALIANLRLATMAFTGIEGAAASAGIASRVLLGTLGALAGIGIISIPIVLQIIKGGEPGLWDFLGAALAGAGGGAMIGGAFGPVGALAGAGIGAIAVPATINIIWHLQRKPTTQTDPIRVAWGQYLKAAQHSKDFELFGDQIFEAGDQILTFEQFTERYRKAKEKLNKIGPVVPGEDIARGRGGARTPGKAQQDSLLAQYNQYLKALTKEQLQQREDYLKDLIAQQNDPTKQAADLAKERAQLHAQAWEDMQQKIEQAVDQMGQVYDKFLQQNKDLFGALGEGPVMSGMIGSMFSDINDMLMQFGQTVPIPISIINQDLEMQMANFTKLREGYAALLKKGVPLEVVQEIQQMGLAGLPFVQGLVQASGPEFQKFVNNIKSKQKDIEKYTKIDFNAQLAQWKKYGGDIASAIIGGLSTEAARATLEMGFKEHVTDLFGSVFQKEMAAQIAKGIADYKKQKAAERAASQAELDETQKDIDKADTAGKNAGKGVGKNTATAKSAPAANAPAPPPGFGIVDVGRNGIPRTQINNYGDTNQITANGVTPSSVTRAMQKKQFQRRNKKK